MPEMIAIVYPSDRDADDAHRAPGRRAYQRESVVRDNSRVNDLTELNVRFAARRPSALRRIDGLQRVGLGRCLERISI